MEDGWRVIREMTVRGAPLIAIVAALSLAVECVHRPIGKGEKEKEIERDEEDEGGIRKKREYFKKLYLFVSSLTHTLSYRYP